MYNKHFKQFFFLLSVLALNSCVNREILQESSSKKAPPVKSNEISIFLVKPKGEAMELVGVKRRLSVSNKSIDDDEKLTASIEELLSGPNQDEQTQGLGSEIPKGTVLLGIKDNEKDIELDLSKRFALGGGVGSVETRLEQLKKTINSVVKDKAVYLNIEGERLNTLAGEGVEVHQPINR